MNLEELFWDLYSCPKEDNVREVLKKHCLLNSAENWKPYGGNENNFATIENQQSSAIPALVEKITNGIDAMLEKRCLKEGIDPKSEKAPRSIKDGIETFFPDHGNWDLGKPRQDQAENLQILADGPRLESSLIIYDNGIGQSPDDFEDTFLSLHRGNKNEIHFVQGKYNMGGAGAIAFCGEHRFQLIGSRRFDGSSEFGFTLVRRHPLSGDEEQTKKNTWYEFLVINGKVPSFAAKELDLGLRNRKFTTGTIIKLFSYQLPFGSRSVISRDLNQSLNEFLFDPALPLYTIDRKERYPDDRNLERNLFGLKRRLEEDDKKYVESQFSAVIDEKELGQINVTCYVFKPRSEGRSAKDTRDTIRREFFKNNMSVLFSINGQVHGHYTSEFITRTLKFSLLKDYLLIHVDCTEIRRQFRDELFMASRDRLKNGKESEKLRGKLGDLLSNSPLKDIHKARKASITVEGNDAQEMLKQITHNLPIKDELAKLFNQTFKLDDPRPGKRDKKHRKKSKEKTEHEKPFFKPERFPSTFKIDKKEKDEDGIPIFQLPLGGSRIIKFSTDVEDQYFDRVSEPGEMQIRLLNERERKNPPGPTPPKIQDYFNIIKSSPSEGTIRLHIKPTEEVKVGDAIRLKASISSPNGDLEAVFMVKITEREKKKKIEKPGDNPDQRLGLPTPVIVYEKPQPEPTKKALSWEELDAEGIDMNHEVIVKLVDGSEGLSDVYINMDSATLLDYRSKCKSPEAITVADNRYLSAVYFHTLFLYAITKNRRYQIRKEVKDSPEEDVDITDYISDLFSSAYAQFLLGFDTQGLIDFFES